MIVSTEIWTPQLHGLYHGTRLYLHSPLGNREERLSSSCVGLFSAGCVSELSLRCPDDHSAPKWGTRNPPDNMRHVTRGTHDATIGIILQCARS